MPPVLSVWLTVHTPPFECSIKALANRGPPEYPTATQVFGVGHDTPSRVPKPSGFGVGWIVQVPVDFRCFEIPDRFVVGCGLDYKQLYRNLGYIAVMNPEKG